MVQHVIKTCRPRTNFVKITASRGKVQRAEPFSALYEQGKVRHVGYLNELEDELAAFSTYGYTGAHSPNRADSAIWALAAGLVKAPRKPTQRRPKRTPCILTSDGWDEARKRQLGAASCHLAPSDALPANMREVIEVSNVHVDEWHRRKGVANRLMDMICEEADKEKTVLDPDARW